MTQWVSGLASVAEQCDGFVLDQFGVLHDGQRTYPGVLQTLHRLRDAGRPVLVLSNSGKRAAYNAKRLARFGITPALYDGVVSSGEMCWQLLQQRDRAPWAGLGRRVYLVHPADDAAMVDGLGLDIVPEPTQADCVLLASLPPGWSLSDRLASLEDAARRGCPLICANPDLHRLGVDGLEPSSGALARGYEALGAPVLWCGKPHLPIYDFCRERMAALGATRICAVGDSLAHDVLGASRAGFASCFISGGIHADDFAAPAAASLPRLPAEPAAVTLARLLAGPAGEGAPAPDWAMPQLCW